MQELNLGFEDLEPIDIQIDHKSNNSVNFGTGAELLMNDKRKHGSSSNISVDLGELDQLEQELNELGGNSDTKTLKGFTNNLFDFGSKNTENDQNDSRLGSATANSISGVTKSFDGFSKINDIPVEFSSTNKITDREKRRKKRMMIKKLDEWHDKGLIKNSSHFNTDSPYEEVEDEYESSLEDKRKKDSVKVQGWWFMTFVHSVEYANAQFDPFDVNLDGWGEQISEDLDSYEEIFSELYSKYKGGKISPEISLLLRLGFSASMVNFTNKALSSATPGFNDVIKQSPELMKMFTKATTQAMSQNSPGFNFANTMLNKDESPSTSYGPPPSPVETKLQPPSQRPPPMSNMQFSQRPDISAGRGMFREQGIDIDNNQENINRQERTPNVQQRQEQKQEQQQRTPVPRAEMKGPRNTDMNNLLSGLKTQEPNNENDSLISASSMRDMMNNNRPPKRTKRKSSEKNTISIDI